MAIILFSLLMETRLNSEAILIKIKTCSDPILFHINPYEKCLQKTMAAFLDVFKKLSAAL